MSKIVLSAGNIRLVLLAILALAMLLSWTAAAHAQTSRDAQYDSPTASGEAAITASEVSGTGEYVGSAPATGEYVGSASATAASATAGSAGLTGVLPATGGPLAQLLALGAVALISTGLLVVRLTNRR